MTTVVMHNVVSVDGFIADDDDDVGPLFDWYSGGCWALLGGAPRGASECPWTDHADALTYSSLVVRDSNPRWRLGRPKSYP